MNLTQSMQDYLKTIFLLTSDFSRVPTTSIAQALQVQPASVTSMMKKLAELDLIEHQSYHGVALTPSGRTIALEMIRHHRLLETYLATALGYDWADVHEEAERLEHYISEEFEDRITAVLGDPLYDPHGDPIPTRDGFIPPSPSRTLAEVPKATTVTIRRVNSSRRELLTFLSARMIGIGTCVDVVATNAQSCTIRFNGSHRRVTLPREISANIFIE